MSQQRPVDHALDIETPAIAHAAPGALETRLRQGKVVSVVEARPPTGPDLTELVRVAGVLGNVVDAFQLTDMPFATPHVANLAAGARLAAEGHEVVLNVTCRDRNSIAQQGTLLGAAALGILNVFCIRGDRPDVGDHPTAQGVFELSGLELVALAKALRDEGRYRSGRPFTPTPKLFVGAAIAPHASYGQGPEALARRKIEAGADFLVTQPVLDGASLTDFVERTRELWSRCFLFAGIGPVTTLPTLDTVRGSGEVFVPPALEEALRGAPEAQRARRGMEAALEVVDAALAAGARGVLIYPFDCTVEQTREFAEEVRNRVERRAS